MYPEGHFAPDCISRISKSLKINRFWWFLEVHVLRMLIFGCRWTYSNIFWSILTNDGMWAAWRMLGRGRLPPSPPKPPPTAIYEGLRPSNSPYFIILLFLGTPKKTWNEKMYIEMVKCCLDLWRWPDSWQKRWLIYKHFISIYIYLCMLCCVSCLPSPNTPIHKGIHNSGTGAEGAHPRRPKAASFMDGCVGSGEAADAAKHA